MTYPYDPCPCGEMVQHCALTRCDREAMVNALAGRYGVESLSTLTTARLRWLLAPLAKGDRVTTLATGAGTVRGFVDGAVLVESDETGFTRACDPMECEKLLGVAEVVASVSGTAVPDDGFDSAVDAPALRGGGDG